MKRALVSFVAMVFIFSNSVAFAQMPVGMSGIMPPVSPVFEKIGVVAIAQGKVELKMPGQIGRIAQSGEPVFIGEEVKTDAKGHLQILLLDETVFTIGPNSSITIDKFVYDPNSHDGEIRASITKGIFRYVSGKIATKRSDNVSVKLPTASIGFRGTIVGGQVNPNGSALAALLGPGTNNDAHARIGSFSIDGQDGSHQDVNRTGFGVEVNANGGLSGVFQLSNEQVNSLTSGLRPSANSGPASGSGSQGGANGSQAGGSGGQGTGSSGQPGGTGGQQGGTLGSGNMSTLSGETGVITAANSSLTGALTNLSQNLNNTSTQAAQAAATNNDNVADGITTLEQLTRITTGTGSYNLSGVFTGDDGTTGKLTGQVGIDFGHQTIITSGSFLTITTGPDTSPVQVTTGTSEFNDAIPFSSINNGSFTVGKTVTGIIPGDSTFTQVGTFTQINIALRNAGGVTAQQATASVRYDANTSAPFSPVPSGSGTATGSLQRT